MGRPLCAIGALLLLHVSLASALPVLTLADNEDRFELGVSREGLRRDAQPGTADVLRGPLPVTATEFVATDFDWGGGIASAQLLRDLVRGDALGAVSASDTGGLTLNSLFRPYVNVSRGTGNAGFGFGVDRGGVTTTPFELPFERRIDEFIGGAVQSAAGAILRPTFNEQGMIGFSVLGAGEFSLSGGGGSPATLNFGGNSSIRIGQSGRPLPEGHAPREVSNISEGINLSDPYPSTPVGRAIRFLQNALKDPLSLLVLLGLAGIAVTALLAHVSKR